MTVKELYRILNEMIPQSLSCEWDNDGLMCCPDSDRQVKKVLCALDVTAQTAERAIDGGYDLIVSHHPMIFKGLKAVNEEDHVASKAIDLIKNNISVMSFHTRLDALKGGVNDTLAELLGLTDISAFGEEAIGRVGTLPDSMSLSALASLVKERLCAPFVLVADAGRAPHRIAVLGGEGGDDIALAREAGADTYISGRLGYHNMTDAPECGMNLIEAGHFYTEAPVCYTLVNLLKSIDDSISADVYMSNQIKAI